MLSGINLDSKSATVEWYENGETKGKEVCIASTVCDIVIIVVDLLWLVKEESIPILYQLGGGGCKVCSLSYFSSSKMHGVER